MQFANTCVVQVRVAIKGKSFQFSNFCFLIKPLRFLSEFRIPAMADCPLDPKILALKANKPFIFASEVN